jgi:hypothetical protein
MRSILIFSLLVVTSFANSQNMFPVKFTGCVTDRFRVEGEILTAVNKDSLLHSIIYNLDQEIVRELKGEIYVQIIVDTFGIPCCLSIKNNLNSTIGRLHIDEVINTKTKWPPPITEEKIKVAAVILLKFNKKKISLTRLGYNGKTGWKELETCFISR